jgi:Mg2+-importing ATPase
MKDSVEVRQKINGRPSVALGLAAIRKFMITFGLVSSVFDLLTFAALLLLHADQAQFRTGWFLESVISASLIVLVIRSRGPFLIVAILVLYVVAAEIAKSMFYAKVKM